MKKTLTFLGRAFLMCALIIAAIFFFLVADVYIYDRPIVWITSVILCIASFVGACLTGLNGFDEPHDLKTSKPHNLKTSKTA